MIDPRRPRSAAWIALLLGRVVLGACTGTMPSAESLTDTTESDAAAATPDADALDAGLANDAAAEVPMHDGGAVDASSIDGGIVASPTPPESDAEVDAGAQPTDAGEDSGAPDASDVPSEPPKPRGHLAAECGVARAPAADDYVLFDGEALAAANDNALALFDGWKANESWDNGKVQSETEAPGSLITFSNEGIYHGFKFTPPSVNGQRRKFTIRGAEIHVSTRRNSTASAPTFGLRLIKPGEFEGAGGAPTTTWMQDQPGVGSRFLEAPTKCQLVTMHAPQAFIDSASVADRLIWEMQSNWSPSDKIVIHRIVLTGFHFVE